MSADKDFKEQNNYREAECCGNCTYSRGMITEDFEVRCHKTSIPTFVNLMNICDKWEHE